MDIEELNKLEEKVNHMVSRLKSLKDENKKLKSDVARFSKESSVNSEERNRIKKKVTTLIELIDSIEKE